MELDAARSPTRAHSDKGCCATRWTTCRCRRSNGPVTVVDHPNNAPAAGFPDLRGKTIDRVAADVNCAGTGLPGIAVNAACPDAVPIADNEISFARAAHQRAPARSALHDQSAGQQRRRELVRRAEIEWAKRLSARPAVPGAYTCSKAIDTTSEATASGAATPIRLGPEQRVRAGATRASTRRTASRSTAAIGCRSSATAAISSVRSLGGWQLSASSSSRRARRSP